MKLNKPAKTNLGRRRTAMTSARTTNTHTDVGKRARDIALILGNTADELNIALIEAEAAIRALELGVPAKVSFEQSPQLGGVFEGVSFGKFNGDWRLLYEVRGDVTLSSKVIPIINASRSARVRAAGILPELVKKLIDTADQEVDAVRAGVQAVSKFAETLKRE